MELNFSLDVTNPKNESYKKNKGNVARKILTAIAYPMRKGIKPHKIKNNLHLTWKKKKKPPCKTVNASPRFLFKIFLMKAIKEVSNHANSKLTLNDQHQQGPFGMCSPV